MTTLCTVSVTHLNQRRDWNFERYIYLFYEILVTCNVQLVLIEISLRHFKLVKLHRMLHRKQLSTPKLCNRKFIGRKKWIWKVFIPVDCCLPISQSHNNHAICKNIPVGWQYMYSTYVYYRSICYRYVRELFASHLAKRKILWKIFESDLCEWRCRFEFSNFKNIKI